MPLSNLGSNEPMTNAGSPSSQKAFPTMNTLTDAQLETTLQHIKDI